MIEETIYSRLSGFAGLTALVSTRIYPIILPQGVTYPAVTYQRISAEARESCMVDDVGLVRTRFQMTAWSETFKGARTISEQLRQALQRWKTSGVQGTYILGEYDLYDPDSLKYGAAIDAQVVHEETV